MVPQALLLHVSRQPLHHAILWQSIGADERLLYAVLINCPRLAATGEHQAIVWANGPVIQCPPWLLGAWGARDHWSQWDLVQRPGSILVGSAVQKL